MREIESFAITSTPLTSLRIKLRTLTVVSGPLISLRLNLDPVVLTTFTTSLPVTTSLLLSVWTFLRASSSTLTSITWLLVCPDNWSMVWLTTMMVPPPPLPRWLTMSPTSFASCKEESVTRDPIRWLDITCSSPVVYSSSPSSTSRLRLSTETCSP